jgi:predicted DNA-binding transcriptional regulator AlpA
MIVLSNKERSNIMSHNQDQFPTTGYLRLPAVLKLFPVSRSTWWAGVKSGRYPRAFKLSQGITAWRAEDIFRLIEETGSEDQTPSINQTLSPYIKS